jgi:PPOX class probable F420-dependent enzyme
VPSIDVDVARRLLSSARVARLATAAGGNPHVVPFTFAVDGDLIYTAVDAKPKATTDLKRLRNIRDNPRVAVLADHYEDDWSALWWVRADGLASVVEDAEAMARPISLLADRYPQYLASPPGGPVVVIQVVRWTGWSARIQGG